MVEPVSTEVTEFIRTPSVRPKTDQAENAVRFGWTEADREVAAALTGPTIRMPAICALSFRPRALCYSLYL